MTQVETSRPLRKDAARNREALLAAARVVFAERGLEASLDDVAHEAGVGVGTAYRHFANKYELAEAIFAETIHAIVAVVDAATAQPDPWDGIVTFLEGTAALQSADRGLREVMMGVHDEAQMDRFGDELSEPLRQLVERAKATGALRQDAEATDIGIVLMMLGTVADLAGDESPDQWRRYLPMLLQGLRPGPPLPVPPMDEASLRVAMKSHKQQMLRAGGHRT